MNITTRLVCIGCILFGLPIGTPTAVDSALEERHHDWASMATFFESGEIAFRTYTTYSHSDDNLVLTMDRLPADCDSILMSMNIALKEAAESSVESKPSFGLLRIDGQPSHNVSYKLHFYQGEKVVIARFSNFERQSSIMGELIRGRRLLLELIADDNKYSIPFSLIGFTAATSRSRVMCNAFNRNNAG